MQPGKAVKLTTRRQHLPLVAWLPCRAAAAVPQNARGCWRQWLPRPAGRSHTVQGLQTPQSASTETEACLELSQCSTSIHKGHNGYIRGYVRPCVPSDHVLNETRLSWGCACRWPALLLSQGSALDSDANKSCLTAIHSQQEPLLQPAAAELACCCTRALSYPDQQLICSSRRS